VNSVTSASMEPPLVRARLWLTQEIRCLAGSSSRTSATVSGCRGGFPELAPPAALVGSYDRGPVRDRIREFLARMD
jgi:hypothetical protein